MPGLGSGFVNVQQDDRSGSVHRWAVGDGRTDDRQGIQDAIRTLVNPPDSPLDAAVFHRGGTLYFPPGVYRIGVDPSRTVGRRPDFAGNFEDIHVPFDVQLMFAPGASLRFGEGAVINIEGTIDAGLNKIFETPETRNNSLRDRTLSTPVNNVFFTGQRIVEVFPEWWGAGNLPAQAESALEQQFSDPQLLIQARAKLKGFRDTFAIQAAIDAACNNRQWNPETGRISGAATPRPPLVVRMLGAYQLLAPLRAGATVTSGVRLAPNTQGLVLRGENNPFGFANLTWNNETEFPVDGLAMLEVRGVFGAEISNIMFDAQPAAPTLNRRARCCLFIDGNVKLDLFAGSSPPAAAQGIVVRRCGFRSATEALVQVGPPLPPYGDSRWAVFPYVLNIDNLQRDSGGHDLLALTFEQCSFTAGGADRSSSLTAHPSLAYLSDGVVLRTSNAFCVRFTGSVFGGAVRTMIRAYGGTFSLEGCVFHCQPVFILGVPLIEPSDRGTLMVESDIERGNGVDVFLMRPPAEVNLSQIPLNGTADSATYYISTGGFSASQCESQSYQFLKTHRSENVAGDPYNTTLNNVHHATVLNEGDVEHLGRLSPNPPAIEWMGPAIKGSKLVLMGCHFSGDPARVLVGPNVLTNSVVSMGTRNSDGRSYVYVATQPALAANLDRVVRDIESVRSIEIGLEHFLHLIVR